jgi:hypothetical protein
MYSGWIMDNHPIFTSWTVLFTDQLPPSGVGHMGPYVVKAHFNKPDRSIFTVSREIWIQTPNSYSLEIVAVDYVDDYGNSPRIIDLPKGTPVKLMVSNMPVDIDLVGSFTWRANGTVFAYANYYGGVDPSEKFDGMIVTFTPPANSSVTEYSIGCNYGGGAVVGGTTQSVYIRYQ